MGDDPINPHIPQYITERPWYIDDGGRASLSHQRNHKVRKESSFVRCVKKGAKEDAGVGTRFKKGACPNCGATSHSVKDCIERPRKKGAKWAGRKLAPDEYIPVNEDLSFDAKRDRWADEDGQTYQEQLELDRMFTSDGDHDHLRDDQLRDEGDSGANGSPLSTSLAGPGFSSCANLRIREDTAKYLVNLDVDSAFFDPKSRSMRQDPTFGLDEARKAKIEFRGDNVLRESGDAPRTKQLQVFAWQNDLHAVANPTATVMDFEKDRAQKKNRPDDAALAAKYKPINHVSDDE
ncbi:pre-mRNA-splicing factor [Gregarina niphandrodes]|uniref:Pre-mRNA-splicing factor SLU7 n=1 Tax=Gregarina niphandrodes TaxID=110365 RepID=A0A023B650_GRENI|nr:pre-mRNA-splicing factor [Gregarina niphandrodes]EZG63180.1 pre-mRNA-splicing factor [Gregarina niphandrodes]|eukprot:XP_011130696.1 pre-mRNA-splicing factor [Gregarina niphandrodes]